MKQSGRSWLPAVEEPMTVDQLAAAVGDATLVVADEEEPARTVGSLQLAAGSATIAVVGPEGALTPDEKVRLNEAGGHAVRLSSYTLRSETAAVALVAALHGVETGTA